MIEIIVFLWCRMILLFKDLNECMVFEVIRVLVFILWVEIFCLVGIFKLMVS